MITHKSKIAKLPFSISFSFRWKNIYLFPQGWTWRKSVADISWNEYMTKELRDPLIGSTPGSADRYETLLHYCADVYKHSHFWLIHRYQFSWLIFDIVIEINEKERLSESFKIEIDFLQYMTKMRDQVKG